MRLLIKRAAARLVRVTVIERIGPTTIQAVTGTIFVLAVPDPG